MKKKENITRKKKTANQILRYSFKRQNLSHITLTTEIQVKFQVTFVQLSINIPMYHVTYSNEAVLAMRVVALC